MYTFLSAEYANEELTAVVAVTEEAAAVCLSESDTPEAWEALQNSGVIIQSYVEPPPPPSLTKEEILKKLKALEKELINDS